jgi:hypothetical protein
MSKTNNSLQPLIKVVLLAVAIILTPFIYATPTHDGDKVHADEMTVNMALITDAEIRVDVKVANEEAKKLVLIIENDRGEELYRKELNKTAFYSRIRFPKANNILEYKIKLKEGIKTLAQYKIQTTSRVVEDVEISKL